MDPSVNYHPRLTGGWVSGLEIDQVSLITLVLPPLSRLSPFTLIEWQVSALAASAYSLSYVSLVSYQLVTFETSHKSDLHQYDNLGQDNVTYLINHSSIRVVFCAAT
jgi:hypothetical protein